MSCLLRTNLVRRNYKLNGCKVKKQKLEHSRRIVYHRDRDVDDRLISRDVNGWCIVEDIPREATRITI